MSFDEMIAVLEKAFQLELKIVDGPAAHHVADGKNVDLNWVYREVIG